MQHTGLLSISDTLGGMCRQITCKKCHKPGWAGCGAHVEQVLGHVAKSDRCSCSADKAAVKSPASKAGAFSFLKRKK